MTVWVILYVGDNGIRRIYGVYANRTVAEDEAKAFYLRCHYETEVLEEDVK